MKKKFDCLEWLLGGFVNGFHSILQFVAGIVAAAIAQEGLGFGPYQTLFLVFTILVAIGLGVSYWTLYMSDEEGEENA